MRQRITPSLQFHAKEKQAAKIRKMKLSHSKQRERALQLRLDIFKLLCN